MAVKPLGRLKQVDVRQIWAREAQDFTPWVRTSVELLAGALGIEIDIDDQEAPVGDFAVDLVGRELTTNRPVIIENQLEATDHAHLGQLLTYAAGLDAGIVVWVAREIREEHRQALDWLNAHTGEDIHFFGVEIHALQIDDSRPAPHFHVAAKPNWWQKAQRRVAAPSLRGERYQAFFARLAEKVKERYPGWTLTRRVSHDSWFTLPSGRSGYVFAVAFTHGQRYRVELYIDRGDFDANATAFEMLLNHRAQIESDFGGVLSWEPLEGRRASRIAAYRNGHIMLPDDQLEQLLDWAVETLGLLREAFRPHLAELP